MLRKNLITFCLVLVSAILSTESKACGDYCSYSALDYTGGSNLLNFGVDVYVGLDAAASSYGYNDYGGGCGSFLSSCNSPYESVGLYGNNWGSYSPMTDISVNLDLSFLSSMNFLGSGLNTDIGCCLGYCSDSSYSSLFPWLMGLDSGLFPPTTMPMPVVIPGMANPYLPITYPFPQYPGTGINIPGLLPDPFFPTIPPYFTPIPTPPTTIPPYGYCDNIVVMCPGVQPPVTQPPTTQPPVVIPPIFTPVPTPPTHQPPTTNPPTNRPPVIIPPTNQPPTIQPPVVIPPVFTPFPTPPVIQPPVIQPPVVSTPVPTPVFVPSPFQPIPVDPNRGNIPRGVR